MRDLDKLQIRVHAKGCVLAVKAVPGASRNRLAGILGGALKVAVAAPPEKGRANKAVAELLAEHLGLPGSRVQLLNGPARAAKEFLLIGLEKPELLDILGRL